MSVFTRQNQLTITVQFVAADGTPTQPQNATLRLVYVGLTSQKVIEDITLSYMYGVWSGVWDSTPCKGGVVAWVARGYGGYSAAKQGSFIIDANAANM